MQAKNTLFLSMLVSAILFSSHLSFTDCIGPRSDKGIRQLVDDITIPKLCDIESKVDIPSPCAPTPIESTGTISGKISIAGPAILSEPGHYCLAQDITANSNGIEITDNNVTLDLNGYTIDGDGVCTNGIVITGNEVTVTNGTVRGMSDTGILLQGNKCKIEC